MLYIYSFMVRINFIVISKVKFCHRLIWEGLERWEGESSGVSTCNRFRWTLLQHVRAEKFQWSTYFTKRSPLNVSNSLKRGKKQKTKKLKGVLFAKVNETDFYQLPHIQFKNNFSLFLCVWTTYRMI